MNKVILILAFIFAITATADQPKFKLYGEVSLDNVRLYWDVYNWPKELKGFRIKKRTRDTGAWYALNEKTIIPDMRLKRDWQSLGLNAEQIEEAKAKTLRLLDLGTIKEISHADISLSLKKGIGPKFGDRLKIKQEFTLALLFGVGFIDNQPSTDSDIEYGLFGVDYNEVVSRDPLSVWQQNFFEKEDSQFLVPITFTTEAGVTLNWHIEKKLYEKFQLKGYALYRFVEHDGEWKKLNQYSFGPTKKTSDTLYFSYIDRSAFKGRSYTYAVAPVNFFKTEYKRTVKVYEPKEDYKISAAEITSASLHENKNIKLTWKVESKDVDRIKVFFVDRQMEGEKSYRRLPHVLKGDKREFIDIIDKPGSYAISYRLTSVGHNGQQIKSATHNLFYMKMTEAPKPTGLKASFNPKKKTIRLEWDKKSPDDELTEFYLLSSYSKRKARFIRHSGIGAIRKNFYDFKIYKGQKSYRFQLQAKGKKSAASEATEVEIQIPTLKMPFVKNFYAQGLEDGNIQLHWDYPEVSDLKGFLLTLDGKALSEGALPPGTRSWYCVMPAPKVTDPMVQTLKFELQAITEHVESAKEDTRFYLRRWRIDKNLPAPNYLSVKLSYEGDDLFADLKWTSWPGDKKALQAYIIEADYKSLRGEFDGVFNSQENKARIKIPVNFKGKFISFRVRYNMTTNIKSSSKTVRKSVPQKKRKK